MLKLFLLSTEMTRELDPGPVRAFLPARYERACRMRREQDRLLCLAAGHLLLRELGIPDESALTRSPYGKLSAVGFPPFSLSHSGRYAVLAVYIPAGSGSNTAFDVSSVTYGTSPAISCDVPPIGADIEEIRPFPAQRMRGLLLPEELAWVQSAEAEDGDPEDTPVRRFFTLWTLKESLSKACGLGLRMDPRRTDALPLLRGLPVHAEGADWRAHSLVHDGHVISICTHSTCLDPLDILLCKLQEK